MLKIKVLLVLIGALLLSSYATENHDEPTKTNKMKIEIWSDVVCPWCYIGKRRFETALSQFADAKYIEVEYKSYQLDPTIETDTSVTISEYLSSRKGLSSDATQDMLDHVSEVAAEEGLAYQLDDVIPINTLQAHALLHFAKAKGKQLPMKERLMKGYFIETLNLDDTDNLVKLATDIGLDGDEARQALVSKQYATDVREDINTAVGFGVRGVPFFVFDRKYAISGAQDEKVFLRTLEKSYKGWRQENPLVKLEFAAEGESCKPDGTCD